MNQKIIRTTLTILLFITASVYSKVFNLENPRDYFSDRAVASVEVSEIIASSSKNYSIEQRTKTSNCKINGSFPDHECTPGAVFENVSTTTICVTGYTKTVRNVSSSIKRKVYESYDVLYPQPTGTYECDHLIPLGLGGSNSIANLFPESALPNPGFKEKDVVENYLRTEVCEGRIDLKDAQKQIANDWVAVYNALSKDEIKALKEKYMNWADKN